MAARAEAFSRRSERAREPLHVRARFGGVGGGGGGTPHEQEKRLELCICPERSPGGLDLPETFHL